MDASKIIVTRLNKIENMVGEILNTILKGNDPDRMIIVNEAAKILKRSNASIRLCIHKGQLKATQKGRKYYLSLYEVRRLAGLPDFEKKQS